MSWNIPSRKHYKQKNIFPNKLLSTKYQVQFGQSITSSRKLYGLDRVIFRCRVNISLSTILSKLSLRLGVGLWDWLIFVRFLVIGCYNRMETYNHLITQFHDSQTPSNNLLQVSPASFSSSPLPTNSLGCDPPGKCITSPKKINYRHSNRSNRPPSPSVECLAPSDLAVSARFRLPNRT